MPPAPGPMLAGPESEAVLRQQFKIIAEVKLFDNRAALFLVAEDGHAFLLAKENVQPDGANAHGFTLTPEGQAWRFVPKDKAISNYTAGNAAKPLVTGKVGLHPSFVWLWRFQFDKVHCKLTCKKPFLACEQDVQLTAGKPVKVTRSE